jgi:predicted enzyme related to lactoylglutathione lyase
MGGRCPGRLERGVAAPRPRLDARAERFIGNQAGGRVFLFLHTDDFARDHAALRERGVRFLEPPRHEGYGTVAVFVDPYGNKWDLIQPAAGATRP